METTPNTYFDLFLGYSAVWLLIVAFVVKLWVNQRRLSRQLAQVEGRSATADKSQQRPEMIRANS